MLLDMKSYSYKLGALLALLSAVYVPRVQTNFIQGRIVSGMPAASGQLPWQVIIKEDMYDNLKCGGSIISDSWVLTAAHCTYKLSSVLLIFGTVELNNNANNMTSNQLFIHPQYNPKSPNNDVSLVKLPTPLTFSSTVQAITLARLSKTFVGETAIIAGFGLTDDEYLDPSPVLLWAQVKIVKLSYCRNVYPEEDINETNMCAVGDGNTNMSTCSGDSGGALIQEISGNAVQIGINSFAPLDSCTEGHPSGYVKVTPFLNYISTVTGLTFS